MSLLFVFEAGYRVDDLADLLRRWHWLAVLVQLFALLVDVELFAVLVVVLRRLLGLHGCAHLHVELAWVETCANKVLRHSVEHEMARVSAAPTLELVLSGVVAALDRLSIERHLHLRVALQLLEDVVDVARDHRQVNEWLALRVLIGRIGLAALPRLLFRHGLTVRHLRCHLHYVA